MRMQAHIIQSHALARFLRNTRCTSAAHGHYAASERQGSLIATAEGCTEEYGGFREGRLAPGGLRNRGNPRGPYAGRQWLASCVFIGAADANALL